MEGDYYDSLVILELYLKEHKKNLTFKSYCNNLLNYLSKRAQPLISALVLGEIELAFLRTPSSNQLQHTMLAINSFLSKCKILSITPESIQFASDILKEDLRLKQHSEDVLHFSIAATHKINFLSIEIGFLSNIVIIRKAKEVGIRIIETDKLIKEADKR